MKRILVILAFLPMLAAAELPDQGTYTCYSGRSFTNTTETTKDNLVVHFWLSKAGNPVVKIVTQDPSISAQPSLFGGQASKELEPTNLKSCDSVSYEFRVGGCARALLPALNDNQNLFLTPGKQYVHSLKITDSFKSSSYGGRPSHNSLAMLVKYRKNNSYWERAYRCTMNKL